MAPAHRRSSANTGRPSRVIPTRIRPSRRRKSFRSAANARIAITSEASVITNWVRRPPCKVTWRSSRSFIPMTRGQLIAVGSSWSEFP